MVRFSKIPRLSQRISTLTFMGNFSESVQLIQPVSSLCVRQSCRGVSISCEVILISNSTICVTATECPHRSLHVNQIFQQAEENPGGICYFLLKYDFLHSWMIIAVNFNSTKLCADKLISIAYFSDYCGNSQNVEHNYFYSVNITFISAFITLKSNCSVDGSI